MMNVMFARQLCCCILALTFLEVAGSATPAPLQPDILLIMADQWRGDWEFAVIQWCGHLRLMRWQKRGRYSSELTRPPVMHSRQILFADGFVSTQKTSVSDVKPSRERMIKLLANRPEGFSDGRTLIPGRAYPPLQAKAQN